MKTALLFLFAGSLAAQITTYPAASGGSGGTPGGSTTQLQYNNAGAFGGAAGITTADGNNLLATSFGSSSWQLLTTTLVPTFQGVGTANTVVRLIQPAAATANSILSLENTSDSANAGRFRLINAGAGATPALTGSLQSGIVGTGTGITTQNFGEDSSAATLTTINWQFNGVTQMSATPTSLSVPTSGGITSLKTVSWTGAYADLTGKPTIPTVTGGACTNQAATAISGSAVPTCTTLTSAYVDGTVGLTGSALSQFAATTSAQLAGVLSDETGTGAAVFGTSPTLTTPAITTSSTLSNNSLGTSPAGGYVIQNTTAAAVGAQQYSPPLTLIGQGWKTTATAASQTVKWDMYIAPVQNTTNPENKLLFVPTTNGVAWKSISLCAASSTNTYIAGLDGTDSGCDGNVSGFAGIGPAPTVSGATFAYYTNGTARTLFTNNGSVMSATTGLLFANGALTNQTTGDVTLDRDAAGILGIQSGAPGTTAANYRALKASALISGGTTFTATGLSVGTLVGGATAGTFALGANGPGTVVVTMGNSATAPTGWSCWVSDRTTLSVLVEQSASTTTTATFNFPAGALSGDVANFGCLAY